MLMSWPRIDCISALRQAAPDRGRGARCGPIRCGPFDDEQPHDRERRDALAGAALADDAERAAGFEAEGEVVDGADDAFFGVEVGAEIGDFEDCV